MNINYRISPLEPTLLQASSSDRENPQDKLKFLLRPRNSSKH